MSAVESDQMIDAVTNKLSLSSQEANEAPNRRLIRSWLNRSMRVKITDGRTVTGVFLCTDKHSNLILGSCHEYFDSPEGISPIQTHRIKLFYFQKDLFKESGKEPRTIGLSMIPGHHVVSIHLDEPAQ